VSNLIVDLQSIRIDVPRAVVKAYYAGNPVASDEIYKKAIEVIKEKIDKEPYNIIDNIEPSEDEETFDDNVAQVQGDK
jgi:hypothetical protein